MTVWEKVPLTQEQLAENAAAMEEAAMMSAIRSNMAGFVSMSPEELAAYIDANAVDMDGVRQILKMVATSVMALGRRALK